MAIAEEQARARATLIVAAADVPLAIGEEFSSKWAFAPFIERGLTEFVRVDICNVGGFTEAMKVAA
ncbi:MAG: mandelate racemase/muconate lactonizing enzyme family protein, partial [Chloroflexales bacterium]|nr:mandelate racemase/muconate lactonizing enzyme family protein [Chloroflexales bacterium]